MAWIVRKVGLIIARMTAASNHLDMKLSAYLL